MKVVGFGEVLGAIRPVGFAAWGDSNEMVILAGGSEANVLAKVGGLVKGIETQFVSKMKDDLMGRLLRYDMQRYRVGMDHVVWTDGDRNGLCFVEQGLGPITAEGGYDRAGSAFARAAVDYHGVERELSEEYGNGARCRQSGERARVHRRELSEQAMAPGGGTSRFGVRDRSRTVHLPGDH